MSDEKVQLNSTVTIIVRFKRKSDGSDLDISSATTKEIILKSPAGTRTKNPGDFVTDGVDGQLKLETSMGELKEWRIQGYAVIDGKDYHTDIDDFRRNR